MVTNALVEEDSGPMAHATAHANHTTESAMRMEPQSSTAVNSHSEDNATQDTMTRPWVRATGGSAVTSALVAEDSGPMAHATAPAKKSQLDSDTFVYTPMMSISSDDRKPIQR